MSETRTTRHHHTNCAIHGTLVNGKLRDCTCTAAATPPTPDRAAVREALVLMLSATPYRLLDPLADALGHKGTFPERVADALLGPAPLPADVQAAVERLRKSVPDGCTERCDDEWCSHALEGVNNAGYNQALDDLLAHLQRTEG